MSNTRRICIYHENCVDGFASAMVMRQFFESQGMENIQYLPMDYGDPLPESVLENVENSWIYLVDFSLPRQVTIDISTKAFGMTIIDHHKSAEKNLVDLPNNVECIFDMTKCGALLTWEHFFGRVREVPFGIELVNDRDLWTKELEDCDNFHAGLSTLSKDMNNVDAVKEWRRFLFKDTAPCVAHGKVFNKFRMDSVMQHIDEWIKEGSPMDNLGVEDLEKGPFINVSDKSLVSDIGSVLCELGHSYAIMYCTYGDKTNVSLRSKSEDLDMSKIAATFGGGGHKGAAGFSIKQQ